VIGPFQGEHRSREIRAAGRRGDICAIDSAPVSPLSKTKANPSPHSILSESPKIVRVNEVVVDYD